MASEQGFEQNLEEKIIRNEAERLDRLKEDFGLLLKGQKEIINQMEDVRSMVSKLVERANLIKGKNPSPPIYVEVAAGMGDPTGNVTVLESFDTVDTRLSVSDSMKSSKDKKLMGKETTKNFDTYLFDKMPERESKGLLELETTNMVLNDKYVFEENKLGRNVLEFDRDGKSMGVMLKSSTGNNSLLVEGIVETLLERSSFVQFFDGSIGSSRKAILENLHQMSTSALRVLGFAYKDDLPEFAAYNGDEDHPTHQLLLNPANYSSIESKLVFVGLPGLRDPPWKEVHQAIEDCRTADIQVIVITRDNKNTAEAFCRDICVFDRHENINPRSLTDCNNQIAERSKIEVAANEFNSKFELILFGEIAGNNKPSCKNKNDRCFTDSLHFSYCKYVHPLTVFMIDPGGWIVELLRNIKGGRYVELLRKVANNIKKSLEILGASGINGELQKGVPKVLDSLGVAGITSVGYLLAIQHDTRKICGARDRGKHFDLKKEKEREQLIAKIRMHAQVIWTAMLFQAAAKGQSVPGIAKSSASPTRIGDFNISPKELVAMNREHDLSQQQQSGGVNGIARKLKSKVEKGVMEDKSDLINQKKAFGSNTYPRKKVRSFWTFVWDACWDTTLIILMVAAAVSLTLGIKTEGIKEGWYDGGSIALAVLIVILFTAVSDYKQSLQFQNLNEEKSDSEVSDGEFLDSFNIDFVEFGKTKSRIVEPKFRMSLVELLYESKVGLISVYGNLEMEEWELSVFTEYQIRKYNFEGGQFVAAGNGMKFVEQKRGKREKAARKFNVSQIEELVVAGHITTHRQVNHKRSSHSQHSLTLSGYEVCYSPQRLVLDFIIGQFRSLVPLLLGYRCWNYLPMSYMMLYNFYRNVVVVLVLFWFAINGFAVHISSEQAETLVRALGVKSVERDRKVRNVELKSSLMVLISFGILLFGKSEVYIMIVEVEPVTSYRGILMGLKPLVWTRGLLTLMNNLMWTMKQLHPTISI